jgi:hypothetical protein
MTPQDLKLEDVLMARGALRLVLASKNARTILGPERCDQLRVAMAALHYLGSIVKALTED